MTLTVPSRHCERNAAGRPGKRQTYRPLRCERAAGQRAMRRITVAGLRVVDVATVVEVEAENVVGVVVVVVVDVEVVGGTVVVVVVGTGEGLWTVATKDTGR